MAILGALEPLERRRGRIASASNVGCVRFLRKMSGAKQEVLHKMRWERRVDQWAYYRASRVNGRVVKDYYGTG